MTVYIVTSGEYSDYGINAVFTSQEQAELYITTMPDADRESYFIEPYETDKVHLEGKAYYGIRFSITPKFNYRYLTLSTFVSAKPVKETIECNYKNYYVTIPANRYYSISEEYEKCQKIVQDWIAKYKYRKEVDEK